MRKQLFIAFLGIWIALLPFLPLSHGTTQDATFTVSGLLVAVLSLLSLRTKNL